MKTKPIIFSAPMVQAILDGRKTQTRRVVKPQPTEFWDDGLGTPKLPPQPFRLGQLLWVRETWNLECNQGYQDVCDEPDNPLGPVRWHEGDEARWFECPRYRASEPHTLLEDPDNEPCDCMRWRPSIHMPRWASRLTLRVTSVRVERVQEISEQDAEAEGLVCDPRPQHPTLGGPMRHPITDRDEDYTAVDQFAELWDSINAKRGYPWSDNPWVWVIEFDPVMKNVDDA